jgi:hypothetical protein
MRRARAIVSPSFEASGPTKFSSARPADRRLKKIFCFVLMQKIIIVPKKFLILFLKTNRAREKSVRWKRKRKNVLLEASGKIPSAGRSKKRGLKIFFRVSIARAHRRRGGAVVGRSLPEKCFLARGSFAKKGRAKFLRAPRS